MHTEMIYTLIIVQKKAILLNNLNRHLQTMDVFCVGLVFSRDQLRYQSYARKYVEALLRLQKQVAIFSPNWIELNQYFQINFREQSKRIHCFALSELEHSSEKIGGIALISRYIQLRRTLKNAERRMGIQIDFLFFAPIEDWIIPSFPINWLNRLLPYVWSGLLTNMEAYGDLTHAGEKPMLPLHVDPGFKDPDYLLSSTNCVAVCTLDRFRSEQLKSRVYKKTIVMPDVSDYDLPKKTPVLLEQIKKMAQGRMIVGTILLDHESIEHFAYLATVAAQEHYFFVCAGELSKEHLSEQDKKSLNNLLNAGRDNNYFILHNIDDYEQINALVQAFDVCYVNAGKDNLPHGILSKAAYFNKPVIGLKSQMNGKLIASFKLGIAVSKDPNDSIQALHTLRLQMPFPQNFNNTPLKNYALLQNQMHVKEAWEMLLWM